MVVVQGQAELLHVVKAAGSSGSFSCSLNSWQQQAHQDPDDGDHYQELDQSETTQAAAIAFLLRCSFSTPYTEILAISQPCQSSIGRNVHKCSDTFPAIDPTGKMISHLATGMESVGRIENWLLAFLYATLTNGFYRNERAPNRQPKIRGKTK